MRTRSLRALYYEDTGEAKLVNVWAGSDYKIIGNNPNYEDLRKLEYQYTDISIMAGSHLQEDSEQHEMYDAMLQGQAFFDNDSDSDDENEIDEVVEIKVPPGPLGVLLDSGIESCAVVHGFTTLPTGGKGPIENDGRVRPGMYIIGINETNASLMSLSQVTQLLGKLGRKDKVIRFAVFRPGSPKKRDEGNDGTGSEISTASRSESVPSTTQTVPPPAPIQPVIKPPPSIGSGFTSRFASLASSMLDKKPLASPKASEVESSNEHR